MSPLFTGDPEAAFPVQDKVQIPSQTPYPNDEVPAETQAAQSESQTLPSRGIRQPDCNPCQAVLAVEKVGGVDHAHVGGRVLDQARSNAAILHVLSLFKEEHA